MEAIKNSVDLRQAILKLEIQRNDSRAAIHEQVKRGYESIQPSNILKTTFGTNAISSLLGSDFIRTGLALLIGQLSKAIFVGSSHSWIKKSMGGLLSIGLTNVLARNPAVLNTIGAWLKYLSPKEEES